MKNRLNRIAGGISVSLLTGVCMPLLAQSSQPNLLYIFPDQYRLQALSLWSDPAYRKVLNNGGRSCSHSES